MGTYQVTDRNVQVSRFSFNRLTNRMRINYFIVPRQFHRTDGATNQEIGRACAHLHDERWSDLDGRVEWRERRLLC